MFARRSFHVMGGNEYRVPAASISTRTATPRLTARSSAATNCSPAGVVVKDVSAERNGFFGGFNRGEHRGKRRVAIDERLDFVVRR